MDIDLPPHLEKTRQMLAGSLRLRAGEPVPAVPAGLLDDLNQRFSTRKIVIEAPRRFTRFRRMRHLFESPAFGMAAAVLLVLAIAGPALRQGPGTFRGTPGQVEAPVRIVLINGPAEISNILKASSGFEPESLITVGDYESALRLGGAKVVLDFENSTIRSHDGDGEVVYAADLPESIADLSDSITTAILEL